MVKERVGEINLMGNGDEAEVNITNGEGTRNKNG